MSTISKKQLPKWFDEVSAILIILDNQPPHAINSLKTGVEFYQSSLFRKIQSQLQNHSITHITYDYIHHPPNKKLWYNLMEIRSSSLAPDTYTVCFPLFLDRDSLLNILNLNLFHYGLDCSIQYFHIQKDNKLYVSSTINIPNAYNFNGSIILIQNIGENETINRNGIELIIREVQSNVNPDVQFVIKKTFQINNKMFIDIDIKDNDTDHDHTKIKQICELIDQYLQCNFKFPPDLYKTSQYKKVLPMYSNTKMMADQGPDVSWNISQLSNTNKVAVMDLDHDRYQTDKLQPNEFKDNNQFNNKNQSRYAKNWGSNSKSISKSSSSSSSNSVVVKQLDTDLDPITNTNVILSVINDHGTLFQPGAGTIQTPQKDQDNTQFYESDSESQDDPSTATPDGGKCTTNVSITVVNQSTTNNNSNNTDNDNNNNINNQLVDYRGYVLQSPSVNSEFCLIIGYNSKNKQYKIIDCDDEEKWCNISENALLIAVNVSESIINGRQIWNQLTDTQKYKQTVYNHQRLTLSTKKC